jgi:prepilin-type N-terminal cleavage/methylation domain-containing protein
MIFCAKTIIIMNNALKSWFRRSKMAGYSLVEVIVVVALISAASAGAFFVISGVTKDSADTKLLRDVATINRAIGVYQASGGNLSDVSEPQAVIDRLKSKMTETEAKQMAGLRGSLVDTRLKAVLQDSGQAALSEQRAFWNPGRQGFYVANSGAIGVREFVLDESLAEVDMALVHEIRHLNSRS